MKHALTLAPLALAVPLTPIALFALWLLAWQALAAGAYLLFFIRYRRRR